MLSANRVSQQVVYFSEMTVRPQAGQTETAHLSDPGGDAIPAWGKGLMRTAGPPEVDRDVAGASLNQLIDALSAAIARDTYVTGEWITVAMAEAAVLERELSSTIPRRWRIQQALNALLKMGPQVTAALAAVLEHPSAQAHIARLFSD